jgi:hypothetical protein
VLYGKAPAWDLLIPGTITASFVLVLGYWVFRRLEGNVADVA